MTTISADACMELVRAVQETSDGVSLGIFFLGVVFGIVFCVFLSALTK